MLVVALLYAREDEWRQGEVGGVDGFGAKARDPTVLDWLLYLQQCYVRRSC